MNSSTELLYVLIFNANQYMPCKEMMTALHSELLFFNQHDIFYIYSTHTQQHPIAILHEHFSLDSIIEYIDNPISSGQFELGFSHHT